ncbi:Heh2/Src1 [Kluyveromyces lactis]|nr:Heh2/Src1 [Kluyveromyces lactis]
MSKEEDSSAADSSFNDSILKDDFDLSTLKIAQLKTVLTSNEIGFKAHDKKASLVKLVEDNLDSIRKNLEKDRGLSPLVIPSVKVTKKKRESKKRKSTTPETLEKSLTKVKASKKSTIKEENEAKDGERPVSKKRKKRTKDEDGQGSDTEETKPVKKTRKTKKKVKSEEIGSPIAKKITTKSPIKSPHRSLIIDKFESSDDASDETGKDDSFINFSIKKTAKPKKSEFPETNNILSDIPNEQSLKTRAEFPSVTDSSLNPSTSESTPIKKKVEDSEPAKILQKVQQESAKKEQPEVPATELPTLRQLKKLQEQVNQSINTETEEGSDTTITKEEPFAEDEESEEDVSKSATEEQSEDLLEDENEIDEGESTIVKDPDSIIEAAENKTEEIPTQETNISSIIRKGLISTGHFLLKVLSFLLILLPILFALWYREQRIAVGFCASEIDIPTLGREYSNPYINEFENQLERFKPQCIPCPTDAICYPYLEIKCKPGYIVEESPLSLHGLIPVHAKCVKDSRKQKLVQEVVKKTLELLRTKNAQESCGEDEDDYKSGISNAELYEIFYESKKPWINDEEFNALWQQVEVDLKEEPEIIWRQVSICLRSTS